MKNQPSREAMKRLYMFFRDVTVPRMTQEDRERILAKDNLQKESA